MSFTKRYLAPLFVAGALVALACALSGCGEQVAATWAHGQILEADVTSQATSMKSSLSSSSSSSSTTTTTTTSESWEDYIKNRSYNSDATDEEKAAGDGTVAQLREYIINDLLKTDVVKYEIEQKNYTISDDELDAYVDEQRTTYEAYYGQGMSGTFESILQLLGYKNLAAFEEEAKETLKERKLQQEVTGKDESDSEFDQDAWDAHVKELVDAANLHINDMPSDLSYDPSSSTYTDSSSTLTTTDSSGTTTTDGTTTTSEDGSTTTIYGSDTETMSIDGDGNVTTTANDGSVTTSTTGQESSTNNSSGN